MLLALRLNKTYYFIEFRVAKRVAHSFNMEVLLAKARKMRHEFVQTLVQYIIEVRTSFSSIMMELQLLYKIQHFSHRWQENVSNDDMFQTFRTFCNDTQQSECM